MNNRVGRPLVEIRGKSNPGVISYERDLRYEKKMLVSIKNKLQESGENTVSPHMIWINYRLKLIESYISRFPCEKLYE